MHCAETELTLIGCCFNTAHSDWSAEISRKGVTGFYTSAVVNISPLQQGVCVFSASESNSNKHMSPEH